MPVKKKAQASEPKKAPEAPVVEEQKEEAAEVQPKEKVNNKDQPMSVMFIQKIKACKTLEDIDDISGAVAKAYDGERIPDDVAAIGESKFKEIIEKKRKVAEGKPKGEWVKVSEKEKNLAEASGKLVGWNPKTSEALIKE